MFLYHILCGLEYGYHNIQVIKWDGETLKFNEVCIPLFINTYAHENMIRIPCPDSAGARTVRERVACGQFSGTRILTNSEKICMKWNIT